MATLGPEPDPLELRLSLCCQLYEEFCEPFSLWECKLAIIHCSGHCDLALVETIWLNIIETELQACTSVGSNDKVAVLMGKMKSLGQEYAGSPRCFPVREYRELCRSLQDVAWRTVSWKLQFLVLIL
jgi:hypothetical protein